MGHVGLTPQTATALGGFKAQGKTAEPRAQIAEEAFALQAVGCFAIVFEAVPAAVTEALMPKLEIPVIGIGAGGATDGQVLVFHDLLGIHQGHTAEVRQALRRDPRRDGRGRQRVRGRGPLRAFPDAEHVYAVEPAELAEFRAYLEQESLAGQKWDWSATEI